MLFILPYSREVKVKEYNNFLQNMDLSICRNSDCFYPGAYMLYLYDLRDLKYNKLDYTKLKTHEGYKWEKLKILCQN